MILRAPKDGLQEQTPSDVFLRDFKRNSDSWKGIGGDYEVRDTLQVARVWNVANMNTNAA